MKFLQRVPAWVYLTLFALAFTVDSLFAFNTATAADFYVSSGVPGVDAGTGAAVAIPPGEQISVYCASFDQVRYRLCQSSSCTATSTDSPLTPDKHNDICVPSGYTTLGLYKSYDGGNPTCDVYKVYPAMKGFCAR